MMRNLYNLFQKNLRKMKVKKNRYSVQNLGYFPHQNYLEYVILI